MLPFVVDHTLSIFSSVLWGPLHGISSFFGGLAKGPAREWALPSTKEIFTGALLLPVIIPSKTEIDAHFNPIRLNRVGPTVDRRYSLLKLHLTEAFILSDSNVLEGEIL